MNSSANPSVNPGRSAGRFIAIVAGTLLGLLAVAVVALGAVLVGMHSTKRDADGFYATGTKTLETPTHALVADKIDVGTDGPGWLFRKSRLGTIRVTARGTPAKPVFVGIARTSQVDAYLRGVAQDEISDLEVDPLSVTYHRRPGAATPAAPAELAFWASRASGSGRQSVTWPVQKGDWAVVVMNADGRPGVQVPVSVGAKAGFLVWLGAGLLGLGGILAAAATACYFGGRTRKSRAIAADAGVPSPATP
jgi:hypothetical protein